MSEDRNIRGQIYPRTDMSVKEDKSGHEGGQKCPLKEDRNVPQIDKVIENVIEKRIEKKGKAKLVEVILPWDTDTFAEAWDQWRVYKKSEHKFWYKNPGMEQASLHNLQNISGGSEATAIAIIGHSIANGYKGLFPPGRGATPSPAQRLETLRGAVEILSQMK